MAADKVLSTPTRLLCMQCVPLPPLDSASPGSAGVQIILHGLVTDIHWKGEVWQLTWTELAAGSPEEAVRAAIDDLKVVLAEPFKPTSKLSLRRLHFYLAIKACYYALFYFIF